MIPLGIIAIALGGFLVYERFFNPTPRIDVEAKFLLICIGAGLLGIVAGILRLLGE